MSSVAGTSSFESLALGTQSAALMGGIAYDSLPLSDTDLVEAAKTGVASAAAAGALAVGALRLPMVEAPKLLVDVLQATHNPADVAIVTGAAFGAWCATAGEACNQALGRYPRAVRAVSRRLPALLNLRSDPLAKTETAATAPPAEKSHGRTAKRLGRFVWSHYRHGINTVAVGVTPYVIAAHLKGNPAPKISRANVKAGIDSGLAVGTAAGAVAESITLISHEHPELAQSIQNGFSNNKVWWAVAGALVLKDATRFARRAKQAR